MQKKPPPLIPKNDVTEPKARLLQLLVKKLLVKGQFQTFGNHGFSELKVAFFAFFSKTTRRILRQIFFRV